MAVADMLLMYICRVLRIREKLIEGLLFLCAAITVFTTVGVIIVLLVESVPFFGIVPIKDFLTDTQWTPLFTDKHYGIPTLLSGTMLTTLIALLVAVPMGLSIAIYLNQYASKSFRNLIKPLLEILAAIPTVVYGYFALTFLTPLLQQAIPSLSSFNSLSAGLVMGVMIIPFISSLSEDALHAVPKSLRDASFGMGATRLQTVFRVLLPAAFSGIVVSIILAFSRAIGETMIVAIAAGQQPNFTFDPTVPVATITTYIVQVSMGDVPQNSMEYKTIFAAGISLFVFTFLLNNVSFFIKKKFQERYE